MLILVNLDTIDLQDHNAPSAKDHSRQPTSPAALGDGPPAPHQAASLRHASIDGHELSTRSPRASQDLSTKELNLLHEQSDVDDDDVAEIEGLGNQRNGDAGEQDGDTDNEDDEGLEDDMMDKISSSPSIDDGGYILPWPARDGSLIATPTRTSPLLEEHHLISSFPFLSTPTHLPLLPQKENEASEDHHIPGEYPEESSENSSESSARLPTVEAQTFPDQDHLTKEPTPVFPRKLFHEDSMEVRDRLTPLVSEPRLDRPRLEAKDVGTIVEEEVDLSGLLLPLNDPLLGDDSLDHDPDHDSGVEDIDQDLSNESSDSDLLARGLGPCDESDDDPDENFFDDPRFVDSGWGGECLRETEDIDFEFVYALHTFVATVEGQANATKGDTMVLLDDSNSYWWLVRVVKDSSIGTLTQDYALKAPLIISGYLPAEHIETPTERLARLNKHRNIDVSTAATVRRKTLLTSHTAIADNVGRQS